MELWILLCMICLVSATIYVLWLRNSQNFTRARFQLNHGGGRVSTGPRNKTRYVKGVKELTKAIKEINDCGSMQISERQCQLLSSECLRLVKPALPDSILKESYCAVRRALKLMQDCCTENWLLKAVEFGDCQEHFLETLLDLHRLPMVENLIGFRGESLDQMQPEFGSTSICAAVEGQRLAALEADREALKRRLNEINEIRPDDPLADQLNPKPSLLAPREIEKHVREFDFLKTRVIFKGSDGKHVVRVTFSNKECVIKMRCSKPEAEGQLKPQGIALQNEANIMRECRHPYAVGLLGYWEVTRDEGSTVPLLLMEFMERDLKDLIRRNKRPHLWGGSPRGFPALDAINLVLPVAKVMRHLHEIEVVHRDLKPQNILYTHVPGTQNLPEDISVKLADFGEAQKVGRAEVGCRVGTVGYMAPEVWLRSGTVDLLKADVFSFGMTFGEVLTGLSPLEALNCMHDDHPLARKFYAEIGREERPPLPKDTPKFVKSIVESCWAWSPAARPSFGEICWKLQNTENLLVNGIIVDTNGGE